MNIPHKLLVSFIAIVAMLCIFGGYALQQQDVIGSQVDFMRKGSMQEMVLTANLTNALHSSYGALQELMEEALRDRLLESTPAIRDHTKQEIARARRGINTSLAWAQSYLDGIQTATQASVALADQMDDEELEEAEEQELARWHKEMSSALNAYRTAIMALLAAFDANRLDDAARILEQTVEVQFRQTILPLVDEFSADAMAEMDEESAEIIAATRRISRALGWTLLCMVAAAIAISLLLARQISNPLVRLGKAATRIQRGDSVEPFVHPSPDEIGRLTTIFFDMVHTEKRVRDALEEARNQLEIQNQALEKTVAHRTADLTSTNVRLREEIEQHERTEHKLSESLEEKETLLKEIHHRVKNNLQIITSLLRLQAGQVDDAGSREMLVESEMRIRSMAMVHEKLYQSDNLDAIDLGGYIDELGTYLMQTYNTASIQLDLQAETIMVPLDTAIPCGLILNELVTNVLKHAFAPGQAGTLAIRLGRTDDDKIRLEVTDDGKGMPPELDPTQAETLGLQLIDSLAQQLDTKIQIAIDCGTRVSLVFTPA